MRFQTPFSELLSNICSFKHKIYDNLSNNFKSSLISHFLDMIENLVLVLNLLKLLYQTHQIAYLDLFLDLLHTVLVFRV
jgi:F0F1-type ATP synthase delta subunit